MSTEASTGSSPSVAEAGNKPPGAVEKPPEPVAVVPHRATHKLRWMAVGSVLLIVLALGAPWVVHLLNTVSTDDAYVNGHVTFVAPRVAGQVAKVMVDDNNRVHKGDLLVQLDREPLQVQVNIAEAAVAAAQADLVAADAQARSLEGQMRSLRFNLDRSIEDVDNQIALLRSRVATLSSEKATLEKSQADFDRAQPLVASGAITREELDRRKEVVLVSQAKVEEALEGVYQVRVALGLPPQPAAGNDLTEVPKDLDQTFSSVRQAQASLAQAAAQIGYSDSYGITPAQMIANFYKQDPDGNIDRIYADLLKKAPAIKQAQSKLAVAMSNLDQAKLNLKYCDVVAEIDGVVTRRDVNPGNNVVVGQSLMAVRSTTDIWIDANFKETQLSSLWIGQPVDIEADMYGSKHHFKGTVSGFTMGTGSTLALLPAENATGNFVKVVQRLPVRIDLVGYDPDASPLFIGLSVTPTVEIHGEPSNANGGKMLQGYLQSATQPTKVVGYVQSTTQPTTVPEKLP